MAPTTAVRPSSSGTPAATSEPNATMRMISVIGSDSFPALPRSSLIVSSTALVGARVAELRDLDVGVRGLPTS